VKTERKSGERLTAAAKQKDEEQNRDWNPEQPKQDVACRSRFPYFLFQMHLRLFPFFEMGRRMPASYSTFSLT
jgi:hypothetical protein